jgi:hypothetical protein
MNINKNMDKNMDKNNEKYRYSCEKCLFFTNSQASYKIHLMTNKHTDGKKATRCDKKYPEKCSKCDYKPKSNTNYLQHTLIYHSTKEERKEKFTFYCETCDYGSFTEKSLITHKNSKKHKLSIL